MVAYRRSRICSFMFCKSAEVRDCKYTKTNRTLFNLIKNIFAECRNTPFTIPPRCRSRDRNAVLSASSGKHCPSSPTLPCSSICSEVAASCPMSLNRNAPRHESSTTISTTFGSGWKISQEPTHYSPKSGISWGGGNFKGRTDARRVAGAYP